MNENNLKEILTGQREEFQRHVSGEMAKQRLEFERNLGAQREEFRRFVEKEHEETRHLFGVVKEDLESKIQWKMSPS